MSEAGLCSMLICSCCSTCSYFTNIHYGMWNGYFLEKAKKMPKNWMGTETHLYFNIVFVIHGQWGIKCLMGCDHKIKTENIMHNLTLRGDKIHNPLSHSSPFWKFWSLSRRKEHFLKCSFRKNTCNFITFWGEGVQNLKVCILDFYYVKPSFDFKTKGFFNNILWQENFLNIWKDFVI